MRRRIRAVKRTAAAMMAAVMCMSGAVFTGYAADDTQEIQPGEGSISGSGRVDLIGEVEAGKDLISVVMPTSIKFQVSTTDGDNYYKEYVSGTGTFTNNSTCAVKLSIDSVLDSAEAVNTDTPTMHFMDVLDLAIAPDNVSQADAFATGGTYTYVLKVQDGGLDQQLAKLAVKDKKNFKIFAKAKTGQEATVIKNNSYTINTILKISKSS